MRCVFLRSPKRLCGQNRITQSLKYIFHDSKSANACTRSRLPTPSSPGWSHLWGFVFGQNGEKATRQDQKTGRMEILLGTTFSHSHTFWRCFFCGYAANVYDMRWLVRSSSSFHFVCVGVISVMSCSKLNPLARPWSRTTSPSWPPSLCATSTAEQTTSRTRTNEPFLGVDVIMMMSI